MRFEFKEGVLLALLPVVAFYAAWMYEMGYADVFGISRELIDVDLKMMIPALLAVSASFVPFCLYGYLLFCLGTNRRKEVRWWALKLLMPLPLIPLVYMSGFTKSSFYPAAALASGVFVVSLVSVSLRARKIGWRQAILAAAEAEGIKEFGESHQQVRHPKIWDKLIAIAVILFLIMIFSVMIGGVGKAVARLRTGYSSFEADGKSYVILAGYGDRFVLGGVKDGKFDKTTYVIPKNSEKLVDVKFTRYLDFIPDE